MIEVVVCALHKTGEDCILMTSDGRCTGSNRCAYSKVEVRGEDSNASTIHPERNAE